MTYQPRYAAYLKTTKTPTNWDFMAFISDMVNAYGEKIEAKKDMLGHYHIYDHDDFDKFIEEAVNNKDIYDLQKIE